MATKKVSCKSKKISKSSNKKKSMKRGGGSRRRSMRGGWPFSKPTPEQSVREVMKRISLKTIKSIPSPTNFRTKQAMSRTMMSLPPLKPTQNPYSAVKSKTSKMSTVFSGKKV